MQALDSEQRIAHLGRLVHHYARVIRAQRTRRSYIVDRVAPLGQVTYPLGDDWSQCALICCDEEVAQQLQTIIRAYTDAASRCILEQAHCGPHQAYKLTISFTA